MALKTEPELAGLPAARAGHGYAAVDDDGAALLILRTGGSIAIVFLLAYLAMDSMDLPRMDGGGGGGGPPNL